MNHGLEEALKIALLWSQMEDTGGVAIPVVRSITYFSLARGRPIQCTLHFFSISFFLSLH